MIQIDVVGMLYAAVAVREDGSVLDQPPALPGWHVNTSSAVPGWEAYRVAATQPRRVFAGASTVFYRFADEAASTAALAVADLTLPEPVHVPAVISRAQAMHALLDAGLLDAVDAAMQTMPRSARIDWETRETVERASPLVAAMAAMLDLDDAQLDALFVEGAKK